MSPHSSPTMNDSMADSMNDALDDALDDAMTDSISDAAALDWARNTCDTTGHELVSRKPWATTWRLPAGPSIVWLKSLPTALASSPALVAALSERFPALIPGTLAHDSTYGRLLLDDSGGVSMRTGADEAARCRLLERYARLQVRCIDDAELLALAPKLDPAGLVARLTTWLEDTDAGRERGARRFLSASRVAVYRALLEPRATLLAEWLTEAGAAPVTIEHGDLRTSNARLASDGEPTLIDWDEAFAGPAGASLHGLFGGARYLVELAHPGIGFHGPEQLARSRREFSVYVDALVGHVSGATASVRRGIAAAATAGVIDYLTGFDRFETGDARLRESIASNLKGRFSDLLDVCDILSVAADHELVPLADHYLAHGRSTRARRLLDRRTRHRPDDAGAWLRMAEIALEAGRISRARRGFRIALDLRPDDARARGGMARVHALRGDWRAAVRESSHAQRLGADHTTELERIHDLERAEQDAQEPDTMPTIRVSAAERADDALEATTLECAARLFQRHGTLLLEGVFDEARLVDCREHFLERNRRYLDGDRHADALRIGDRRLQVTVDIGAPFDAALFGHPLVLPLMRRLLGDDCILGCFTAAMSLPGAKDQRLHKDHKALWPSAATTAARAVPQAADRAADEAIEKTFAITLMLPLVALDERIGTTGVLKGSHRLTSTDSRDLPVQTPLTRLGDCYLMDYRLSHRGRANRSMTPRPILSLVYQRPWFRDCMNFHDQPPLRISQDSVASLPDDVGSLLKWARYPHPGSTPPA